MSHKLRLRFALGAGFLLVTSGAFAVIAQTPVAADRPSIVAASTAGAVSDSKTTDAATLSVATPADTVTPAPNASVSDADKTSTAPAAKPEPSFRVREPVLLPSALPATTDPDTADEWHFQLTPYFWLAGLHGTTGTDNRPVGVDMSFGDIFGDLKFAFMGTFEARRNKIGIVVDTQYVSLEDEAATPGPLFSSADLHVKTFIFDPEVAYRIFDDPEKGAFIDVMGGIRVVKVSTEVTFFPGFLPGFTLDASRTWVDGVVGMRGKAHLAPKIFIVGKFDIGGGGSNFTWQLFGALGYEINKTFALIGGYRVLDINYRKDNFVYDTSQRGPIMGVGIRF
jgi:hypothetical protein